MHVIASAWISGSLAEFEAACCLQTHANLGLASATTPFDIFIMQGYEKLTDAFRRPLEERHIRLHDVSALTNSYLGRYAKLFELLGPNQGAVYEVFCFLRWLVLQDQLGGEPFLHIDLDLFFQTPLTEIATAFAGRSGTFGSPCLTSVGTPDWLVIYRSALDEMVTDRTALQGALGYAGNEFRRDISSDQDLVNALELCGRLPRAGLSLLLDEYQVFINPLWPYQNKPAVPFACKIVGDVDTIADKPVLFWHLQNNFADYISRFAVVSNFEQTWMNRYLPVKLGLPFIQLEPSAENFAFQAFRDVAWQRIRESLAQSGDIHALGQEKFFSRTWVSSWFILQKKGRELFSSGYWWEDGVFQ